jgi:hypothetical protein
MTQTEHETPLQVFNELLQAWRDDESEIISEGLAGGEQATLEIKADVEMEAWRRRYNLARVKEGEQASALEAS